VNLSTLTRPAEPTWQPSEQLLHLVAILRTAQLQAATLQNRRGLNPVLNQKINACLKKLEYCEKELRSGHVRAGENGLAEDYFDNEGALFWEVLNETRKAADRTQPLVVLYTLNAGGIVSYETGQTINA
jgi:hypothetical protein